jgi:hypothetical protein
VPFKAFNFMVFFVISIIVKHYIPNNLRQIYLEMEGASDATALKMMNHELIKLDYFDGTNFGGKTR